MQTIDVGGDAISTRLSRSRTGLVIGLQLHPDIEEFFRFWGNGVQESVRTYGRQWRAGCPPIWGFPKEKDGILQGYTIHQPGWPIIIPNPQVTNISFLRLVGASDPGGVRIYCDDLISTVEVEALAGKVQKACQAFYTDFIQPVNVEIVVTVRAR